jgi:hypothetical protein
MEAEPSAREGPNEIRLKEDMGLYEMYPLRQSH